MKIQILQKCFIILIKIFLLLIGLHYFIFVMDKLLLYAGINPLPRIETMEQLNEEGWVVPLWYQMIRDSMISAVAYVGLFRFNKFRNWSLVICFCGLFLWMAEYYWLSNVFRMLRPFQIRAYFRWELIDFLAISIVLFRQLYLKFWIKIKKQEDT